MWAGTLELTIEMSCCKYPPAAELPSHWNDHRTVGFCGSSVASSRCCRSWCVVLPNAVAVALRGRGAARRPRLRLRRPRPAAGERGHESQRSRRPVPDDQTRRVLAHPPARLLPSRSRCHTLISSSLFRTIMFPYDVISLRETTRLDRSLQTTSFDRDSKFELIDPFK